MRKRPLNNYLHFTKKERTGTIVILSIILVLLALPFVYGLIFKEKIAGTENFKNEIASLKTKADSGKKYYNKDYADDNYQNYHEPSDKNYPNSPKGELFYFDPNTLSAEGWMKLGVKEKTTITIQNYISKGGKFRQPDDIKKIWGINETLIQRLLPYVKIEATENKYPNNQPAYEPKNYGTKNYKTPVDVNNADSTAFIALPGIGSKLSQRIINFRNRLGGFYSIEQVAETFGLPDSTYQKIKERLTISRTTVKKININSATLEEMKQHPYIRYQLANVIVQYRQQHGNFTDIEKIKNIALVNDELYKKLSPYLSVTP